VPAGLADVDLPAKSQRLGTLLLARLPERGFELVRISLGQVAKLGHDSAVGRHLPPLGIGLAGLGHARHQLLSRQLRAVLVHDHRHDAVAEEGEQKKADARDEEHARFALEHSRLPGGWLG
jgi:hypothetical protein